MRLSILAFLFFTSLQLYSQKELYLGIDLNPQLLINKQRKYSDLWDGRTNQLILDYGIKVGGILNKKWDLSIGINFQKRKSGEHSVLYPIPDSIMIRRFTPIYYYFSNAQIEGNHILSSRIYFYNIPLNLKYRIKQKKSYSIFLSLGWSPEFERLRIATLEPIDVNEEKTIFKRRNYNEFSDWKSHSLGLGIYKNWTNRLRSRFGINVLSKDFNYNLVRVSGELGLDFIFLKKNT